MDLPVPEGPERTSGLGRGLPAVLAELECGGLGVSEGGWGAVNGSVSCGGGACGWLESPGGAIEVRCRAGRRVVGERYGAMALTVKTEE